MIKIYVHVKISLNVLGMNASNLSIYYQLPEYIGMGVAEFFVTLAYYEFAYYAAPRSAQSLFMSLRFCSVGVSSMIGRAYIYLFPTISFQLDFSVSVTLNNLFSLFSVL